VETTAFSRALQYLNYSPAACWTARVTAVLSGVLYVTLLVLLFLVVDLMATQGQVPTYFDLSPTRRAGFESDWSAKPAEEREAGLKYLGVPPARATVLARTELASMPDEDRALGWTASVVDMLRSRVGDAAAEAYQPEVPEGQTPTALQLGLEVDRLGVLSLLVRSEHTWTFPLLAAFARYNAWAWAPKLANTPNHSYLVGLALIGVALALLRAVVMQFTNSSAAAATLDAVTRLRRMIYHHTFRLGTLTVRNLGPNEAVSLFVRRMEALHDALFTRLTTDLREPVKFGLLLVFALLLNFWLGLAFLLFAGLVWLLGGQILTAYRRSGRLAARRSATQLALLQESIMLMRLVKGYLMELLNQTRVERQLADYSRSHLQRFRSEAVSQPLLVFLGTLGGIVLLFVAGRIVLAERLGVANVVTQAATLLSLYFPLEAWLAQRRTIARGREAAAAVFEFLDRKGEVAQVLGAEFLPAMGQRLEFLDVSLREPGTGRMLLQGVNLTVKAGQRVGFVGPDDAEKHAIVYLIPRFLDPTSGEVKIDGQNLRYVTLDSLRAQIGMILQHNLIFNDTVANNIGCGDPAYSLPRIIEAAKLAHAHQFIQKLPNGYDTRIGELGHSLRPGEQFRIALARAVLRDPSVYIIEEPPVPLDDDTKALLDDTLDRVLAGKTAIFLPHRVSTIKACDRIFLVHKGRIEAHGEHRDLLGVSELYKHLHYMEFNAFAEQV
jgi:ATP-binding cassette subfamily B protein